MAYNREQIKGHLEMIARLSREQPFVLEFIEHEGHTEVVVCTRDQRQLIAKICGALAVNDINILRADVNTRADDVVLDIFQVTNIDGSPERCPAGRRSACASGWLRLFRCGSRPAS